MSRAVARAGKCLAGGSSLAERCQSGCAFEAPAGRGSPRRCARQGGVSPALPGKGARCMGILRAERAFPSARGTARRWSRHFPDAARFCRQSRMWRARAAHSMAAACRRSMLQLVAHLFQHPQFHLAQLAVGRDHVAGQRIGGLVQAFGQGVADQAEQGVEAVFLFDQVEDGLGRRCGCGRRRSRRRSAVVHDALDRHQFGVRIVLVRGGDGDHHAPRARPGGTGTGGYRALGRILRSAVLRRRLLTPARRGNRTRGPRGHGVRLRNKECADVLPA